jgi:hypothetical protein
VFYDAFDDNPLGSRVISLSCSWAWDPGYRALVLDARWQGPSSYNGRCIAAANINISEYASKGRRVYVAALAWRSSFAATGNPEITLATAYTRGAVYYEVGFRNVIQSGRTGDNIQSVINYWDGKTEKQLGSEPLGGLTTEEWYLSYVASMIDFTAWLAVHWNQTVINEAVVDSGYRFYPDRAGVSYCLKVGKIDSGYVYFDNLVITVDAPPWFVNVTNVPPGWRVVLRSSGGSVVAEAVAGSDGVAVLNVAPPLVDLLASPYCGDWFITANATVEVYDASGRLVASSWFSEVVGGDVYSMKVLPGSVLLVGVGGSQQVLAYNVTASERPVLVKAINASTTFDGSAAIAALGGSIYLLNATGLYMYSWATDSWVLLAGTSTRQLARLEACGNLLAVVNSTGTNVVYVYNVTARSWSRVALGDYYMTTEYTSTAVSENCTLYVSLVKYEGGLYKPVVVAVDLRSLSVVGEVPVTGYRLCGLAYGGPEYLYYVLEQEGVYRVGTTGVVEQLPVYLPFAPRGIGDRLEYYGGKLLFVRGDGTAELYVIRL